MKVKAIQFVPLGRPVRVGDYVPMESSPGGFVHVECSIQLDVFRNRVAHERREVEVEVPDPAPEWIRAVCRLVCFDHKAEGATAGVQCQKCAERELAMTQAFRSLVDERAKAAAQRLVSEDAMYPAGKAEAERIIRECFLEGR